MALVITLQFNKFFILFNSKLNKIRVRYILDPLPPLGVLAAGGIVVGFDGAPPAGVRGGEGADAGVQPLGAARPPAAAGAPPARGLRRPVRPPRLARRVAAPGPGARRRPERPQPERGRRRRRLRLPRHAQHLRLSAAGERPPGARGRGGAAVVAVASCPLLVVQFKLGSLSPR